MTHPKVSCAHSTSTVGGVIILSAKPKVDDIKHFFFVKKQQQKTVMSAPGFTTGRLTSFYQSYLPNVGKVNSLVYNNQCQGLKSSIIYNNIV